MIVSLLSIRLVQPKLSYLGIGNLDPNVAKLLNFNANETKC